MQVATGRIEQLTERPPPQMGAARQWTIEATGFVDQDQIGREAQSIQQARGRNSVQDALTTPGPVVVRRQQALSGSLADAVQPAIVRCIQRTDAAEDDRLDLSWRSHLRQARPRESLDGVTGQGKFRLPKYIAQAHATN